MQTGPQPTPRDHCSPRVLCCAGSLDGGGSERQLWQLACGLDRRLLMPQLHLLYRRGVYLARLPDDVAVHSFDQTPAPRWNWPGRLHQLHVKHLQRVLAAEQIAVVYDRTYHATLMTAPACQRLNVPRVSVIVSPPSLDLGASRERFRWIKRRLLAQAYAAPGARTLAVSQAVADDAETFYQLPRGSVQVVASPVDMASIRALAEQQTAAADQSAPSSTDQAAVGETTAAPGDQRRLRIAIVGRLTDEKGHAVLLHAAARLRAQLPRTQVHLDVLGDGPLRTTLETLAASLDLARTASFVGFQPNPYPWMRRADVVCVPSFYEGLPNVALEAMALGVPVVLSDCNTALRSLAGLQQERAGLAATGDPASLSQQLLSVIDQPREWRQRTAAARTWVSEQHDLPVWLEQMTAILLEMAQAQPRQHPRSAPSIASVAATRDAGSHR